MTLIEQVEPRESSGRKPVPFVVGVARSGTTLLRLMLDAHPDLAIPPETHFIPPAVVLAGLAEDPAEALVRYAVTHPRWPDFGLEEAAFRDAVRSIDPFDLSEAIRVFYRLYARRFDKPRWGDKTPPYLQNMELIEQVLPEARFVHVVRDGRDVALSVKDLWFGPDSLLDAARGWRDGIARARDQAESLGSYLEIRYEDLVRDSEGVLRRVANFLELPWSPSMLTYYQHSGDRLAELAHAIPSGEAGAVVGAAARMDLHALTREPPRRDRVARWRRELSGEQRAAYEAIAGETLRELGYPTGTDAGEESAG